ncbi:MAG: hypothetical protein N2491_10410 [Negativicutes bacterium]|nr:hypothetical protein [Negativicutes bacterium]
MRLQMNYSRQHVMIKKNLLRLCFVYLVFCIIAAASMPAIAAPRHDAALKADCLAATVKAIKKEMDRHRQWLEARKKQGDKKGTAAMEEALARLQADLDKYQSMDAENYVLPEPIKRTIWVGEELQEDPILNIEEMTKSGPWYHVIGIAGGDYKILKPIAKYNVTLYLLYPRSYWSMSSAYVYIAAVSPADSPQETKRIQGEVFARLYSGSSGKLIKCDAYKIYLLPNDRPGTRGELLLEAQQSEFDITIPAAKIRQYPYIEFVSPYGSKTIDLREVKDGEWLELYLVPQVIVKKPVIYLYPENVQPVEIRHDFKGRLLTTFPEYHDGWTVIASPSGDLLNTKDNRHYQYLFWDGIYDFPPEHYRFTSGFAVKRGDYAAFLQEKLTQIGLSEREINDFIVYWLPEMNQYPNCFIRFRLNDNIGGSSTLTVKPQPQTMIRLFMEFYGFNAWKDRPHLPEQNLPSIARQGFTLVEWGGSKLDFFTVAPPEKDDNADFAYLGEDKDIRFYGLPQTGQLQELRVRLELGPAARERLQRERPPTIGPQDVLANIAAAECRIRVSAANEIDVIEQVWLDDNKRIVGRVESSHGHGGDWPANHLASESQQFLKRWLMFGDAVVKPPRNPQKSWANDSEKWLWGIIDWDTGINEAKRFLTTLGFAWQGGSELATGEEWLKLPKVPFVGLSCEYKLTWRNERLVAIDIASVEAKALGVDAGYSALVSAFTADYGSPTQKVSYTLKSFPPVLVERTTWMIKPDNGPAFIAAVGQERQLVFPDVTDSDAPGKLTVSFRRLVNGG